MKIHEFIEQFPDETSCRLHFKKVREKQGISCKKCDSGSHYWLPKKWQWQCKDCKFRTTLRSGTSLQYAKLSFHKWYLCMALMTATKKGISAKEMQRQLGHQRYRTIWELMQKVRSGMMNYDKLLELDDILEKDEEKFLSNQKSYKKTGLHYAFMEPRQNDPEFESYLEETSSNSRIESAKIHWIGDKRSISPGFHFYFNTIMSFEEGKQHISNSRNWVNIIAGNARRNIIGVYHKVSTKYLQQYLSEFCYRLNRRTFNEKRFDSLILAVSEQYCGTLPTIQKNQPSQFSFLF